MARDANHALFADLSNNNRYFNAARYRRAGHRLVALKASEGDGFVDERHARWSAEAHHAGLAVVHYCYCTPGRGSGRAAADLFWSVVDRHFIPGRDRLALDMEVFDSPGTVSAYLAEADGRLGALATASTLAVTLALISACGHSNSPMGRLVLALTRYVESRARATSQRSMPSRSDTSNAPSGNVT